MKYLNHYLSLLVVFTLFFGACSSSQQQQRVQDLVTQTKNEFVPDSRVNQFNVSVSESSPFVLSGETTLPEAKQSFLDALDQEGISYTDEITLLPTQELGDKTYALVNNSVANIRSTPKHPAQLATQALLGMPLRVLKKEGGWYYVRTPDDYLSWIDGGGMHQMNKEEYEAWKQVDKVIFTESYGFAYAKASKKSQKISDLAAGNILKLNGTSGSYYKVEYPDGREAFVPKSDAIPLEQWVENTEATQQSLVATAKDMMGVPYLWGGTSTKGVDCSGYTKTIYFMNGMIIPRDASQQVHAGIKVDDQKNWDELEVGDLLFFGKPATDTKSRSVTHVGMWIGDNQFIHSSRQVRISSVDSSAPNYDEFNTNRYLESRRYLQNAEGNIIPTNAMYDEFD